VDNNLIQLLKAFGNLVKQKIVSIKEGRKQDKEMPDPFLKMAAKDGMLFTSFIQAKKLNKTSLVLLLFTLAPHFYPTFFDDILNKHLQAAVDFPQIGGVRGKNFRGFLPTGETVLFILAGNDEALRLKYYNEILNSDLIKQNIISIDPVPDGEPLMSGRLVLDTEYVALFLRGKPDPPKFSLDFPAELLTTDLTWEDIVLPAATQKQIDELQYWVNRSCQKPT
jgi:hypothetical protein